MADWQQVRQSAEGRENWVSMEVVKHSGPNETKQMSWTSQNGVRQSREYSVNTLNNIKHEGELHRVDSKERNCI